VGIVSPDHYPEGADLRPLPSDYWDRGYYRWGGEWFADDIDSLRAAKWAEVKAHRELLEAGAAPTPFGPVQCDDRSKLKINGLVQLATIAAAAGEPFDEEFTLADNQVVPLTGQDMIAMGVAVARHVSAIHAVSRLLRAQIHTAGVTIDELLGLDVAGEFATALSSTDPV